MGFSITGYVLEPPRVGQSNSPYTATPNNYISNQAEYDAAYPSSETNPRDDYLVLVTSEVAPTLTPGLGGPPVAGPAGLLVNAGFGWTKNEVINRLDYDTHGGRFRTLPGSTLVTVGTLGPTSNTQRLKVVPPVDSDPTRPFRLSIGDSGSGITQTVALVETDGDFSAPPVGTTQLSLATGNLNWNTTDLATYAGQIVRWQQQQYFALSASTGNIGTLSTSVSAPAILLNPIPGDGQFPLVRIGYLLWLTTVEKPDEAHFTPFPGPPSGTVEWALTTGRLNFSNTDVVDNAGTNVYYDGTLFARDLTLPRSSIGTVSVPTPITLPNPATGDLIFALPNASPYYQFPQFSLVSSFSAPGTQGTVEINSTSGAVQFSTPDQAKYGTQAVEIVYGDLPIDHGVSMRFFRSPVDLDAQTSGVKDVTALYSVQNAVWSSNIMGSPLVFLPSTPIDNDTLQVSVGQGTGTFTGPLNPVDTPSPPAGLGYYINFDTNQLSFAQRKNNVLVQLVQTAGFVQLPDTLLLSSNASFSLETGPGTGVFLPLTLGDNAILDATAGIVYFTSTEGVEIATGSTGTFSGTTFSDPSANFTALGVEPGDFLLVTSGYAMGMYTIVSVSSSTSVVTDVPPPAGTGELSYEILSGEEILADRFFMPITLTDPTTSVERITAIGTIANETTIVTSGSATFPDLTTLSDPSTNFTTAGVQPGDTINLPAASPTSWFLVLSSTEHTLTPTVSFVSVSPSTYSVTRRLQIPTSYIGSVRFRYGSPTTANPYGVFSTTVNVVANDGDFSNPASLPQGTVEISQATGNLNFSSADVAAGGTVYVSRELAVNTDYQTQPQLGLIQFTSRLLTNEEVLLTYVQAPPTTTPPTPAVVFTNERGTFLVRKELVQPHPVPTSTLFFNPTGKSVALDPAPTVYRGGRPQVTNTQVTINPTNPSSMTFLPDNILTNALPHGAIVGPTENVYIDYYVYQAMGGEQNITVLNPPLQVATVTIVEGTTSVVIAADQTENFPEGFLLLVNSDELYQIGTVSYDPVANQTTVNLGTTIAVANVIANGTQVQITTATPHGLVTGQSVTVVGVVGVQGAVGGPFIVTVIDALDFVLNGTIFTGAYGGGGIVTIGSQLFQSDQTNPPLLVASGPTPLVSTPSAPSYFVAELNPYLQVARGVTTIVIPTNRTSFYETNTVVYITDAVGSFTDFYLVTSSQYSATTNQTTVTLASSTQRQYVFGSQIVSYSVRPVYGQAPTVVHTSLAPLSSQPITVVRRVAGEVGQILSSPTGYTIDDTGTVTYTTPLLPNEAFGIFYTGHTLVAAGVRLEASYTSTITPTSENGLLGQVLNANYTIFSPDNFYYRVETMTNFKAELQQAIQAQAQSGSPSSGPMTSNTGSQPLYDQGRPSLWFPEGDYANQDIIARACLLFFNNAVNYLEDVLQAIDGRVVGDQSGRFLFDGSITNPVRSSYSEVTNQIDDYLIVSPFPLPNGTTQQVWTLGPYSRFYRNRRVIFTSSPAQVSGSTTDGTIIAKFDFQNLSSLPSSCFKRWPRAQIQFDYPAGTVTFTVDNANGTNDSLQRPSFVDAMRVVIEDAEGNFYILASANTTVSSFSATSITLSAGPSSAVPAGATIYVSPSDANSALSAGTYPPGVGADGAYNMIYHFGKDVNANLSTGDLLYITRKFPFDGTIPLIPFTDNIFPIQNGDIIEVDGAGVNVPGTTPTEFPALTGQTVDDDGNQAVPIVGPLFTGELTPSGGGPLNVEAVNEVAGSPFRTTTTTPPFVGTGNLNATTPFVTITLTSGTFPSPVPKVYDLVRIMSGVNGQTSWRRATSVTTNSITVAVADAFASHDTGFSFAVAVSETTVTGTATLTGTDLNDPLANFTSTVQVGWTVVMTSGPNAGLRRQVDAIPDATDLTLSSAFPSATGGTYRVDNPLNTYNGTTLVQLQDAVATELATISTGPSSEQNSLINFFTTIFTTIVGPSTAAVSGTTLTDNTVDFIASGVNTSYLVYIEVGSSGTQLADMGVYQIGTVTSSHVLTLNQSVPVAGNVTYQVVSIFGTTFTTLQSIFTILTANAAFVASTETFQTLLTTTVPVLLSGSPDPLEYANGIEDSGDDLGNRYTVVTGRLSYLNGSSSPQSIIEGSLNSSDQLYAKRFTWINERINLQTGLLVLEQTAVAQRIAAQQQVFNQLIMLLTLQGSG